MACISRLIVGIVTEIDCFVLEVSGSNLSPKKFTSSSSSFFFFVLFCEFPQLFRACAEIAASFYLLLNSFFITSPIICRNIISAIKRTLIYQ